MGHIKYYPTGPDTQPIKGSTWVQPGAVAFGFQDIVTNLLNQGRNSYCMQENLYTYFLAACVHVANIINFVEVKFVLQISYPPANGARQVIVV